MSCIIITFILSLLYCLSSLVSNWTTLWVSVGLSTEGGAEFPLSLLAPLLCWAGALSMVLNQHCTAQPQRRGSSHRNKIRILPAGWSGLVLVSSGTVWKRQTSLSLSRQEAPRPVRFWAVTRVTQRDGGRLEAQEGTAYPCPWGANTTLSWLSPE